MKKERQPIANVFIIHYICSVEITDEMHQSDVNVTVISER